MSKTIKIHRDDFISIIGFYSNTALVDKKIKKQVSKKSIHQLLEQGNYKEAVYAACYENTGQDTILSFFEQLGPRYHDRDFDSFKREYGIDDTIRNKIQKIKRI